MPVRNITFNEPAGPDWTTRAFAGHEALYKAQVMESTWGHLAPKQGKKYTGFITFALAEAGGDYCIIESVLRAGRKELDGSPWLHDDINDFICEFSMTDEGVAGHVYQFVGIYVQSKHTGKSTFTGTITRLDLAAAGAKVAEQLGK